VVVRLCRGQVQNDPRREWTLGLEHLLAFDHPWIDVLAVLQFQYGQT
jgi:hypothetical protein